MKRIRLVIIFMACLSSPIYALAVETGTALKTDVIRKEPYSDAQKIGEMVRSEKIQILNKKGAWLNIKTSRTMGWVRLLSVKKESVPAAMKSKAFSMWQVAGPEREKLLRQQGFGG